MGALGPPFVAEDLITTITHTYMILKLSRSMEVAREDPGARCFRCCCKTLRMANIAISVFPCVSH